MTWTSTKSFAEGPGIFAGNDVLTAAILERLLHHGSVISTWGGRINYTDKLAMWNSPAPGWTPPVR
ncbi:MAG TPA: hypothetical protein DCY61_00750 [Dehalococcoidia bacterium]|nr:hypothetical protein [Dehalococcoidia bacterium]